MKFCLSQNVGILVLEAYSFVYLVSVIDLYSVTSGHGKLDVCNHVALSFLFVHFEINLSVWFILINVGTLRSFDSFNNQHLTPYKALP